MLCYIPQLVDDPSSPVGIMPQEMVQTNSPSNFVSSRVCFSLLQNIIKETEQRFRIDRTKYHT